MNLVPFTHDSLAPFDLFYRESQKVWDGAVGLCLARATGRVAVDRDGRERTEIDGAFLTQQEPVFDSTVVGQAQVVEWFLPQLHSSRRDRTE